jgi:hypothetical protein
VLRSGRADALLLDLPVALGLARAEPRRFQMLGQLSGSESLAAVLPKDSPNLDIVDSSIRALTADGTISHLASRWLGQPGGRPLILTSGYGDPTPDPPALRAIEQHVFGHGFDGRLRTTIGPLEETVPRNVAESEPSVVVVDDPEFDTLVAGVPLVVVRVTEAGEDAFRVLGSIDPDDAQEIARRLADRHATRRFRRRGGPPENGGSRPQDQSTQP